MASGCAGHALEQTEAPRQDVISWTGDDGSTGGTVRITREEYVARTDLEMPVERVFAALSEAYQRVGLPSPELDPAAHVAAVEGFAVTRRLQGVPLSRYLECGSGITGAYADTHRVRLYVNTALEPAGAEQTIVRTRVEATAAPTGGGGGTRTCSSMGALELEIAQWLHKLSIIGGT
jgi:uncharacterized protein YndB with AHSA1/START domain